MDVLRRLTLPMRAIRGEEAFVYLVKANQWEETSGEPVIHTEIGDLNIHEPSSVFLGMATSVREHETTYGPSQGLPALRVEIAKYVERLNGVTVTPEQVIVTMGAKAAVNAAIAAFVGPGVKVLYPAPGYPSYYTVTEFVGGIPVPIPLRAENGFRIDPDDVRKNVDGPSVLILNSPHNPTGSVSTAQELCEIARIAVENEVAVITDEVYGEVTFNGKPAPSIFGCGEIACQTVLVQGASKMFAFTGGRIGWCVVPIDIVSNLTTYLGNVYSCCPLITQAGVLDGLRGFASGKNPPTKLWQVDMLSTLKARRDYLCEGLSSVPNVRFSVPEATFYVWVDIRKTGLDCVTFADRLLREQNVSVLPGTSFGPEGEGYIRMSFGSLTLDQAEEAPKRMRAFIESL